MRAALILAAGLSLAGAPASADVNPLAGRGEPDALETECRIVYADDDSMVRVFCEAAWGPGEEVVRRSLAEGYGFDLIPGGAFFSTLFGRDVREYRFVIDTGERPLKPAPNYPMQALTSTTPARCVAQFDVLADGSTSISCVTCAARRYVGEFESAVSAAVSRWLYAPLDTDELRTIRVEIPFAFEGRSDPPALAQDACAADVSPASLEVER